MLLAEDVHRIGKEDCFCGRIKCQNSVPNTPKTAKNVPKLHEGPKEPVFPFHHSLKKAIDHQIDNGLTLQFDDPKLIQYQNAREKWKDQNVNLFVNHLTSDTLKLKPKPNPLINQSTSTPRKIGKSVLPNIYVESPIYAPPQFENWIDSPRDAKRTENQFEMVDLTVNDQSTKMTKEIQFSEDTKELYSEKCEDICQLICILFILAILAGFGYFIYWYFFTNRKSYY